MTIIHNDVHGDRDDAFVSISALDYISWCGERAETLDLGNGERGESYDLSNAVASHGFFFGVMTAEGEWEFFLQKYASTNLLLLEPEVRKVWP